MPLAAVPTQVSSFRLLALACRCWMEAIDTTRGYVMQHGSKEGHTVGLRPGRIKDTFKSFGPCAKPRPTMTLLTTRTTKRCRSHQGLSRIRPPIRMGVM